MIEESTTTHYKELVSILGKKYVTEQVESPYDFIKIAQKGLSSHIVKNFRTYFNVSQAQTAHMLNVSEPTLYRWGKSNKSLERNYSIKLFEITDLFLYGRTVFGLQENFFKWLALPNTSLGGMEPQTLIEMPGGVSKVKDVLGRIEHGIYS